MKSTNQIWIQFVRLEKNRHSILEYLGKLPFESITQAYNGSWSMIQALRHIELAEKGSIAYLKKKSQAGAALPSRKPFPRIMLWLINMAFRSGLKFKAPPVIQDPPITSLDELKNDWENTRVEMKAFLEKYPDELTNRAVYKHPFAGMLNITDAIRFFNIHLDHHIRQAYRIERSIKN